MMHIKAQKPSVAGFTLIELAVVLTIMGLLVGNGLAIVGAVNDNAKKELTERRLEYIKNAIDKFVDYHGYLPCPANPTTAIHDLGGESDFGFGEVSVTSGTGPTDSSATDATCTTDNIIISSPVGFGDLYIGALPVYSLNIHPSYAFDGWNNRFMYVVVDEVIFRGDAQDQTGGARFERGTLKDGTRFIGYASGNADGVSNHDDTSGHIKIYNDNGSMYGVGDAIVVVHSSGANGLGAWPGRGGTRLGTTGISSQESENINNDRAFKTGFASVDNDDHLIYLSKWMIDASEAAAPESAAKPVANCPEGIPGCRMWLDAGQNVTADGSGNVEEWVGRSDYAVTFVQPTAGNRPALVDPYPTAQLNGAAIDFETPTTTREWLAMSSGQDMYDGVTAITHCSVILGKGAGTTSPNYRVFTTSPLFFTEVLNATDEAWEFYVGTATAYTSSAGSTTALDTPSSSRDAEVVCYVIDTDANTASTYVNGVQTLNDTSFTETFPGGSLTGAAINFVAAHDDFAPVIAEIVYYNRALDTTELNTITTYLTDKHLP